MSGVLIFGAGHVAEVMSGYLRRAGRTINAHVIDTLYWSDARPVQWINDAPIITTESMHGAYRPPASFMVGMSFKGLNNARASKFEWLCALGYEPRTFVHSMVGNSGSIGRGSFVMDLNIIQDGVVIGENCMLWSGNHIGYHSKIGNHVWLSSGIVVSGACEIGDYSFIGSGATIADGVKIGKRCIIGAGSLVLQDVPDDSVVAERGTPISKVSSARAARLLG